MKGADKLALLLILLGIMVLGHEVLVVQQPIELKDFYVPFLKMYPYLSHEAVALILWVLAGIVHVASRLK